MSETITRPILRYHGGKWRIAPWIISNFPSHKIYVEPFCGAASVLMQKSRSSHAEVLNDKHGRIINVFSVLRNKSMRDELQFQLLFTPYSEIEYRKAREISEDPIEDARRMLILGHMSHASTGSTGGKKSGFRRGVRASGTNSAEEWSSIHENICGWAERLRSVYIECRDAEEVIRIWDKPETLFYVDPPYVPVTRTSGLVAYEHEMSESDHERLSVVLKSLKGMVVLSGYDSALYDELYPEWIKVKRDALADKGKKATEVLWISGNAYANTIKRLF